jgi:hypothetical protein
VVRRGWSVRQGRYVGVAGSGFPTDPFRPLLDGFGSVSAMDNETVSFDELAWSATIHVLTGCAIGEVLRLVIATALG